MSNLVSLKVAKLAKSKGFNEICMDLSYENSVYSLLKNPDKFLSIKDSYIKNPDNGFYIPSRDRLQSWLKGYGVMVTPGYVTNTIWQYPKSFTGKIKLVITEYEVNVSRIGVWHKIGYELKTYSNFSSWNAAFEYGLLMGLELLPNK